MGGLSHKIYQVFRFAKAVRDGEGRYMGDDRDGVKRGEGRGGTEGRGDRVV